MKSSLIPLLLLAGLSLLALPLFSQNASPTDLGVSLTRANGNIVPSFNGLSPGVSIVVPRNPLPLVVSCTGGIVCNQVSVLVDDQEVQANTVSQDQAAFSLSLDEGEAKHLVVRHGSTPVLDTQLQAGDGGAIDGDGAPEETSLATILSNPCEDRPATVNPPVGYDRRGNQLVVLVTPGGAVLAAPVENMDEDDILVVQVLADPRLFSRDFKVERKSPIRTVGNLNLVGSGLTVPASAREQEGELFPPCQIRAFVLKDFAPGEGEVELSALNDKAERSAIGNFNLLVHRLYHGMLSFGALRSDISDKAFGLAPQGDSKIIVLSEDGGHDTFYAVLYTPFIWGKRDIEKEPLRFLHRINPTFGVTVNDFSDNALAGVSIEWGTFVFTGGVHLARVLDLSEESGLKPGDPFTGEATEIPTTRHWKRGAFLGVSVDLRAATQLLQTLASGGGE